jgi:hypothetical protein
MRQRVQPYLHLSEREFGSFISLQSVSYSQPQNSKFSSHSSEFRKRLNKREPSSTLPAETKNLTLLVSKLNFEFNPQDSWVKSVTATRSEISINTEFISVYGIKRYVPMEAFDNLVCCLEVYVPAAFRDI